MAFTSITNKDEVKFKVHDFNEAYDEFDMSRAKRLGKGGFGKVKI